MGTWLIIVLLVGSAELLPLDDTDSAESPISVWPKKKVNFSDSYLPAVSQVLLYVIDMVKQLPPPPKPTGVNKVNATAEVTTITPSRQTESTPDVTTSTPIKTESTTKVTPSTPSQTESTPAVTLSTSVQSEPTERITSSTLSQTESTAEVTPNPLSQNETSTETPPKHSNSDGVNIRVHTKNYNSN
ncbi:hypothetical protein J6590_050064 [Homalodisca vitripennis]|nr:hypothetical protein J6590_050064 [Homalodisca vitripennis]